jgi:hypothetical protein
MMHKEEEADQNKEAKERREGRRRWTERRK